MSKRQSKSKKLWSYLWPYMLLVSGFGTAIALVALEQAYLKGHLAIDYGNYIAPTLAGIIILAMIIVYLKKLFLFYQHEQKTKNRPSK
jgi:hypothetical protein